MSSLLEDATLGLLQTPGTSYSLDGVAIWAMDNGCFAGKYPGDEKYLQLLDKYSPYRSKCLFVAAPDIIGDARRTLELFPEMARKITAAGYSVALVAQDGMTVDDLPPTLPWLFVGGSTEFKLGPQAEELIKAAQQQGTKVHIGRVNSGKRYRKFAALGCDSADGTFLAFGYDANINRLLGWIAKGEPASASLESQLSFLLDTNEGIV